MRPGLTKGSWNAFVIEAVIAFLIFFTIHICCSSCQERTDKGWYEFYKPEYERLKK